MPSSMTDFYSSSSLSKPRSCNSWQRTQWRAQGTAWRVFQGPPARNECTCHSHCRRYAPGLRQSNSAFAGHCLTSRPTVLWCKRLRPCPPDLAWLLRRVRDCIARPVGPGRLNSRGDPSVYRETLVLFFCPLSFASSTLRNLLLSIADYFFFFYLSLFTNANHQSCNRQLHRQRPYF